MVRDIEKTDHLEIDDVIHITIDDNHYIVSIEKIKSKGDK